MELSGYQKRKNERKEYFEKHVYKNKLKTCGACGGYGSYKNGKCGWCKGTGKERERQ